MLPILAIILIYSLHIPIRTNSTKSPRQQLWAQIRPCGFYAYQMWARSGPTLSVAVWDMNEQRLRIKIELFRWCCDEFVVVLQSAHAQVCCCDRSPVRNPPAHSCGTGLSSPPSPSRIRGPQWLWKFGSCRTLLLYVENPTQATIQSDRVFTKWNC